MKIRAIGLMMLLLFGSGMAACNPGITFDVDIKVSATVEGAGLLEQLIESFGFGGFLNMDFSTTQEFKNNNVLKEHVSQTKLKLFQLKIESPTEQNFDFIEKIELYVEAPGLEKKLIASKTVPRGVKEFDFDLLAVELAPYVKAASVSFTTKVTGRKPAQETKIQAHAIFQIFAQVFKSS